jgi:hypothetical protein
LLVAARRASRSWVAYLLAVRYGAGTMICDGLIDRDLGVLHFII